MIDCRIAIMDQVSARSKRNQTDNTFLGERYEFKYLMSAELSHKVESYIESLGLDRDRNSLNGAYLVNSMYFETPFLDDYQDKEGSLLIRKKMRARQYGEFWDKCDDSIFLEIKNKRNFHISKERNRIASSVWKDFIREGDVLHLIDNVDPMTDSIVSERFAYLYEVGRYSPHITVKYDRTAYLDDFMSKVRITFDRNIRASFVESDFQTEFSRVPVTTSETVMEVKFNGQLPWWFRTLVDVFNLQRVDFSKYNHSVAKLRGSYRIPISR